METGRADGLSSRRRADKLFVVSWWFLSSRITEAPSELPQVETSVRRFPALAFSRTAQCMNSKVGLPDDGAAAAETTEGATTVQKEVPG